jgi:hypothetical protein
MRIITAYPIVRNGKVIANKIAANTLNFASAEGDKPTRGQQVIDTLQKAKEAGLGEAALRTLKSVRGNKKRKAAPAPVVVMQPVAPEKSLSTNAKIAIGVGAAAILGLTIYLVKNK